MVFVRLLVQLCGNGHDPQFLLAGSVLSLAPSAAPAPAPSPVPPPSSVQSLSIYNQRIVSVPLGASSIMLYYRTDLLPALNLTGGPPRTWDRLVDAAAAAQAAGVAPYGICLDSAPGAGPGR